MKLSVFFDLETTDTCFMGQILNYAFIAVDESWSVVDECCGTIRVSRLQLPTAGAILANRVDIRKHQREAQDVEKDSAMRISDFIISCLNRSSEHVKLIGYNSARFDLPFIRTTLIRNGLNPYLKVGNGPREKKMLHGDLLLAAQKLVTTSEEFALMSLSEESEGIKRRLTLQHLTQQFGLLTGKQSHESRDDVLLTIALAKAFAERFSLDIRSWSSYEGGKYHSKRGEVFLSIYPDYDLSNGRSFTATPITLIEASGNGSLWVDLFQYEERKDRGAVFWKNCTDGPLFIAPPTPDITDKYTPIAIEALKSLQSVTLRNFFSKSVCDIEQDIYRLDFADREILYGAIWGDSKFQSSSPDLREIYKRFRLANLAWGGSSDEAAWKALTDYANYRYGGKAIIKKSYNPSEESENDPFHPTAQAMLSDIQTSLKDAKGEDEALLHSLETFYRESDIFKCLGLSR